MNALDWLLAADPAIRWQAMRDLTDAPADRVAAERARVATEGWGARLLALRREDGQWETGKPGPEWPTLLALLILRDMGLDPSSAEARDAIARASSSATWHSPGSWQGTNVFAGEVEPASTGVVAVGAYFGLDMSALARLLGSRWPTADGIASRRTARPAVVPHDDQCPRGTPGNARDRRIGGARARSRAGGVPARTPPAAPALERRADPPQSRGFVPARLPLRWLPRSSTCARRESRPMRVERPSTSSAPAGRRAVAAREIPEVMVNARTRDLAFVWTKKKAPVSEDAPPCASRLVRSRAPKVVSDNLPEDEMRRCIPSAAVTPAWTASSRRGVRAWKKSCRPARTTGWRNTG